MSNLAQISDDDLMASLPRGVRNNNPLNVEDGAFARSHSGYAGSDGRFAKFKTMDDGLAAADHNLQAYHQRHGLNTVSGIVKRWAPPVENDTGAYARSVAQKTGVDPDQALDMADPSVRRALLGAMAEHENGVAVTAPPASDLSGVSDADLMASLQGEKPAASPVTPAKAGAAPRVSQALGFGKGAFKPVDHGAELLERAIRGSALEAPLANMGSRLRSAIPKGVTEFIDNPQGYYDAQKARGVVPGKLGEFAGNVAGTALIPGGPLVQGAAGGVLLGDAKDVGGVLRDATIGGVTGRLTAAGSDALQLAARKVLSKTPKVLELAGLQKAVKDAYAKVDASGFVFPRASVSDMADDFAKTVGASALSKSAKDDAHSVISYARGLSKSDLTLSQLEKLRGDIYESMVKKGGDTSRIGSQFRAKIDDMINAVDDGTVKAAREMNARFKKAEFVTKAAGSADLAAERTYGGDFGRKVKDRIAPLVDPLSKQKNFRGGTPDEVAALNKIARGTKTQNLASTVGGMLDPRRMGGKILSGMTTTAGGASAPLTGGASLLVPAAQMGAGFALTGTASKIARKNVDDLLKLIAVGGSKQALAKMPTRASQAAEQVIAMLRPAAVASAVPGQAAARRRDDTKAGKRLAK